MPKTEVLKHKSASHFSENLQLTYGHIARVRVEPSNPIEIIDCDCCIRQYWRITHFLIGLISELVIEGASALLIHIFMGLIVQFAYQCYIIWLYPPMFMSRRVIATKPLTAFFMVLLMSLSGCTSAVDNEEDSGYTIVPVDLEDKVLSLIHI